MGVQINYSHFVQMPGILKPIQLILCIILWICLGCVSYTCTDGGFGFMLFTSICSFLTVLAISGLIATGIYDQMRCNNAFLLLCLIIWICLASHCEKAGGHWFLLYTSITSFLVVSIISGQILIGLHDASVLKLITIELIYTAIWTLCYFISVWISVAAANKQQSCSGAYIGATFFNVIACLTFGVDFYFFYRQYQQGREPELPRTGNIGPGGYPQFS